MGILDVFGGNQQEDNADVLPSSLKKVYLKPHRSLGLDESSVDISLVRETFRKTILGYCHHFAGLSEPKMTLQQVLLAYHLVRGTLTGPASVVKEALDRHYPYFDFRPDDILPILRPARSKFPCAPEYRGFRMFSVKCINSKTSFAYVAFPRTVFVFDVHYCLRRGTVERDYYDFKRLHEELSSEMLTLPSFPSISFLELIGMSSKENTIGAQMADYLMRVYELCASMGFFNARVLKFVDMNFEQVHSEEEGAIMQVLDTPLRPMGTVWHMVNEPWLVKWRRFVLGRGARRYLPPGPIDNSQLLAEYNEQFRDVRKLKIAKDYRAVNYNVWRFYEIVHGGGPNISRNDQEIFSEKGFSMYQAVIMIQSIIRMFIARCRKDHLYANALSLRPVAKTVLYEMAKEDLQERINEIIKEEQDERTRNKLNKAIDFTITMWRKKKNFVAEENLVRLKQDQEIFTKSKGANATDEATGSEGLVIREILPIVHVGNTLTYVREITEEDGKIPFKLKRIPASGGATIADSKNPRFTEGSMIISINSYPTVGMDYDMLKKKLMSAPWPLRLELEMPMKIEHRPTIHALMSLGDESLQYNVFKILIGNGMELIKHTSNGRFKKDCHVSRVRITDKEFFYMSRPNKMMRESDHWKQFSLYSIKFIRGYNPRFYEERNKAKKDPNDDHAEEAAGGAGDSGKGKGSTKVVDKEAEEEMYEDLPNVGGGLNRKHFFEVVADDRNYLFEIPTPERLEKQRQMDPPMPVPKAEGDDQEEANKKKEGDKRVVESTIQREKKQALDYCIVNKPHLLKPGVEGYNVGREFDPEAYHEELCIAFVRKLKDLVKEIRGSQIYSDKYGMPIKRNFAKTALKKVDLNAK